MNQQFFQKLIELSGSYGTVKSFHKGELIIKEGEIEKNLYYIVSGAARVFLLTEYEELTIRFGYQGSFINSLNSFIRGTPSEFFIDVIRKSEVRSIPKEAVLQLAHQNDDNKDQYISLLETLVCQQIEREIDLLTVSPTDRLNRVLQRSPALFQEIPLKYIASYLRMTPETLSRIRNS